MTVLTTTNKVTYVGDNSTLTFSFPFVMPQGGQSDISAYITDSSGNITTLAQGTQYTVIINPTVAPNPTPVGGSISLTSTVPLGSTLTILRTLLETQPTSLANQGALWQPVIEAAFDDATMQIQQLQELLNRQITVAVSDPTPTPLPPAAQRANLTFQFDSSGNPIAAAPGGATTPVSSAMAPVVAASTIAGALALLGLTGVAPEPTGMVKAFAGSSAPTGYVLCAGQAISRTTFATLFGVIGTTYGIGDGSTTFNVPDLRGRVVPGLDNMGGITAGRLTSTTIPSGGGPTSLGGNGGFESINQTVGMMPSHTHTDSGHGHNFDTNTQGTNIPSVNVVTPTGGGSVVTGGTNATNSTISIHSGTANLQNTGGGTPTPQVQPSIVMNYIIKT